MDYQEFPKVLKHPAHQRARKVAEATPAIPPSLGVPLIPAQPEQWEPERFADVTVMSADDEAYYVAKGYVSAGNPDAAAFETAHASPFVAGRKVAEWPKIINGVLTQDPDAPISTFAKYPMWLTPEVGEPVLVASESEEKIMRDRWAAASAPIVGPGDDDGDDEDEDVKPPPLHSGTPLGEVIQTKRSTLKLKQPHAE